MTRCSLHPPGQWLDSAPQCLPPAYRAPPPSCRALLWRGSSFTEHIDRTSSSSGCCCCFCCCLNKRLPSGPLITLPLSTQSGVWNFHLCSACSFRVPVFSPFLLFHRFRDLILRGNSKSFFLDLSSKFDSLWWNCLFEATKLLRRSVVAFAVAKVCSADLLYNKKPKEICCVMQKHISFRFTWGFSTCTHALVSPRGSEMQVFASFPPAWSHQAVCLGGFCCLAAEVFTSHTFTKHLLSI